MIKYVSGLNGIRAIAVFMVIIWHRFPENHFLKTMPVGPFGVNIFFVLSGYLISRILFNDLKKVLEKSAKSSDLIKRFIYRRCLRIFPIYYLVLFFMYFTDGVIGNSFSKNFFWYFFYGSNYLVYINDNWYGCLAHLWSLAVEEQFYLIWPILVFIFFKNRIFFLVLLIILIGTISPLFIEGNTYVLTTSCINAFGIGALLSYVEIFKPEMKSTFIKWSNILALFSVVSIYIYYYVFPYPFFFERLLVSLITVSVIAYCRYSPNSFVVSKVLESKVLIFIGTISYGIYLYHHIFPKYWVYFLKKVNIETASTLGKFSYSEFIIQTLFIILLSYLSWIIIEKPILRLKDKFN